MMDLSLLASRLPRPANPDQAAIGLEHWRERAERLPEHAGFARELAGSNEGRALLDSVFGNSPYLGQTLLNNIPFLARLLRQGPEAELAALLETAAAAPREAADEGQIMATLRQCKQRLALLVALSDMGGLWELPQVTGALTRFAEVATDANVRFLLDQAARSGALKLRDAADYGGYTVIGMGKLGARELNYSSDIDLIVLYDSDKAADAGLEFAGPLYVRLTRNLVRMMQERTADGYVFRTDLRLRPDPGSTPLAMSMLAAETYYESVGQNWERAAMIKARPIAGDIEAGNQFIRNLRPYVWRKSLDFAAVQDIHSIKRQINAYRGGGAIAVHGHNIKLGRGGIREIEFFAQTQQLIFGGRRPELRAPATCDAIRALVAAELVEPETATDLLKAYDFLRRVEHRLQMIADHQTHSLPQTDAELDHLAVFLGYPGAEPFVEDLLQHLRTVERHYAHLFEDAPSLSGGGNLVFTGAEDDPETLATLGRMGFTNPSSVANVVRQWHHGRYRATATARSRELLTELVPTLLEALGSTTHPDSALLHFDKFLAKLPAGVQLFSLFYANPGLLRLVAAIMGGAPRLAIHLAHNPILFDAMLTHGFLDVLPSTEELAQEAAAQLDRAESYEEMLDAARRWTADRKFQTGVQLLTRRIDQEQAGKILADVAAAILASLLPRVEQEFARQHGSFGGSRLAIVALGKLGSGEMTNTSDLDLMFVYDVPPGIEQSDGDRPLPPIQYYTRFSQRMINAITAMTNEGQLYEVDMRLRPSGSAGPLACSLEAFETYQAASAWTWEHMALVRARTIAGPPELRGRLDAAIRNVLLRQRDPERLLRDVADMRARIAEHNPARGTWDLRLVRGGLFDIDFVAQYLLLRHAPDRPDLLAHNSTAILAHMSQAGVLPADMAEDLIAAGRLWRELQALLRLAMDGAEAEFDPARAPEGLRRLLADAAGMPSFEALVERITTLQQRTAALYAQIIAQPAARLAPSRQEAVP